MEGVDEVLGGLFIGSYAAACNQEFLQTTGITHILTTAEGLEPAFPTVGDR